MKKVLLVGTALLLICIVGAAILIYLTSPQSITKHKITLSQRAVGTDFTYSVMKQQNLFVLMRAARGADNQPISTPQKVADFTDSFGQSSTDSVLSMQISPDQQYLAISGSRDYGEELWIYNTQSEALVSEPPHVLGIFLHWMSGQTGHSFLYSAIMPQGPQAPFTAQGWNPGLWIVDAADGSFTNLNIGVPSASIVDASSSPDGSKIVYSTSAGLNAGSDVWEMQSDGSQQTHLMGLKSDASQGAQTIASRFTWSPDGKTIAFERLTDSSVPFQAASLWVMNPQGQQTRRLATTDGGHGYDLNWSPDSQKIAFIARTNFQSKVADQQMQALQTAVSVANVQSGQVLQVASSAQTGLQMNVQPHWSQDSSKLSFVAFNPLNTRVGGTVSYWSAPLGNGTQIKGFSASNNMSPIQSVQVFATS